MNTYSADQIDNIPRKKARVKECARSYGMGKDYSPLHLDHSDVILPSRVQFEAMLKHLETHCERGLSDMERQVAWRLIYNDGWRPTGDFFNIAQFAHSVHENLRSWRAAQEKYKTHMIQLVKT